MGTTRVTNHRYRTYTELEDRLHNHVDNLFNTYSKLLLLRVDLSYRKYSTVFNEQDIHGLCADMSQLEYAMKNLTGIAGYSWAAEYGEDHRHHVHVAIFINGQKRNKPWALFKEIRNLWDEVTLGEGNAYRCVPNVFYENKSEKVITWDNRKGRDEMKYIISYMAKCEQKPYGDISRISTVAESTRRGRSRSHC